MLGVEEGGLLAAEGLLLARYFMFSQVYFHHTRRIYDKHLQLFLNKWLPNGKYPIELEKHLTMTDNDVNVALYSCALDSAHPAHKDADRIVNRNQFRVLYSRNPEDIQKNPAACQLVYEEAVKRFGAENVINRPAEQERRKDIFPGPWQRWTNRIITCPFRNFKTTASAVAETVFIAPELRKEAEKWIKSERINILSEGKLEHE